LKIKYLIYKATTPKMLTTVAHANTIVSVILVTASMIYCHQPIIAVQEVVHQSGGLSWIYLQLKPFEEFILMYIFLYSETEHYS